MQTRKITSPLSLIFLLSTLAGMAIHFYLTNQHIDLKYGIGEGSAMCNMSEYFSCGTAIVSKYSELFGIPLAVFGLFTNMAILFFGLKVLLFKGASTKSSATTVLALSVFSVLASFVMAGISFFVLKSLCPFCTMAYVCSIITLATAYAITKPVLGKLAGEWKALLIAGTFILVGSFAYGQISLSEFNKKDVKEFLSLQLAEWDKTPVTPPELVEPLKYGPDLAKMKIIEYADFLCPHCRVAYGKLHTFAKANPGVQILFQPFPLDGCSGPDDNPGLRCQLAMAAYCAEKQSKGWPAQEYLFHHQEQIAENGSITWAIENMSTNIKADRAQIDACMKESGTLATIKKQMEGGKKLGIEGTPTIYVNDRKFRGAMHLPLLIDLYNKIDSGAVVNGLLPEQKGNQSTPGN
jgi:protein-disulfide isomerase/uncharacterized membrane protein